MKKNFFGSYLNVLLFITATVLLLSVAFTLIAGMSPLEAVNIKPLAGTLMFVGVVIALIVIPIVVKRLRGKS